MELKINLADRDEIAAAVPLLQLILENTFGKSCGGQCSGNAHAAPLPSAPGAASVASNPTIGNACSGAGVPPVASPVPDPAAVFAGRTTETTSGPNAAELGRACTAAEAGSALFNAAARDGVPAPFASTATAPVGSTPSPTSALAPVELDSRGLPWDERINTSNKGKTAKGVWKRKPGVEDAFYTQVENELKARAATLGNVQATAAPSLTTSPAAAPAGASLPTASGLPAAPVPDPAAVFGGAAAAPLAATAAPANSAPMPGSAGLPSYPATPGAQGGANPGTALPAPATFEELMPRITAAVGAQVLPPTAMQAACVANGLTSVVALQTNPAYVPHVWAYLQQQFPGLV
jgi:hypothetical protein